MIVIRPERATDRAAIHRVNERAFGRTNEAALVDALRENARPHISLVAADGEHVLGHIFFSPVSIAAVDGESTALGLGPMAVLPGYQRQGIGSRLVRCGLDACIRLGHGVVVVLGHPHFYPRFGFSPAVTKRLRSEYRVPDEVFMVAELSPRALRARTGLVKYRPEFAQFGA